MTHWRLLRVFTYLGFRGSGRRNSTVFPTSVAPVLPQCQIQVVTNLWHSHPCTTRQTRKFRFRVLVSANRGGCSGMGQASSFVRWYYGGGDENAGGKFRQRGIYEGLKELHTHEGSGGGKDDSAKVLNGCVEIEEEQEAVIAEPEEVSKRAKIEEVAIEEPVQSALNVELYELGEPPERPLPGDCCGQGCDVCVWDTYNDELRDYLARKEMLKKSKESAG